MTKLLRIRNVIQRAKPDESHANPNSHSEPLPTAPRTKRVHSNSNRKNTFSDYEFSIFTLCSACRRTSYKAESKACERYFAFAQYDAIKKKRTHYPMNSLFSLNKNLATSYLPRKWPSKYFHRNESLRPCSGWERVFSSRLVTKNVVVTISIT